MPKVSRIPHDFKKLYSLIDTANSRRKQIHPPKPKKYNDEYNSLLRFYHSTMMRHYDEVISELNKHKNKISNYAKLIQIANANKKIHDKNFKFHEDKYFRAMERQNDANGANIDNYFSQPKTPSKKIPTPNPKEKTPDTTAPLKEKTPKPNPTPKEITPNPKKITPNIEDYFTQPKKPEYDIKIGHEDYGKYLAAKKTNLGIDHANNLLQLYRKNGLTKKDDQQYLKYINDYKKFSKIENDKPSNSPNYYQNHIVPAKKFMDDHRSMIKKNIESIKLLGGKRKSKK